MTCKDCIHRCICNEHEILMLTVDNLYELMYQEGVDKSCEHFRNKADFVEVVKCRDCKYYEIGKSYTPYCNNVMNLFEEMKPTDFCSYGERRKDAD